MGVCPAHSKSDVSIVERTPCLGLPQAVNVEGLGPQEDWLLVRGRGGGCLFPVIPSFPIMALPFTVGGLGQAL